VILGFRRGVNDVSTLLGCYVALTDSWLPTDFSGRSIGPIFDGQAVQDP
jgi:hypothetical protein